MIVLRNWTPQFDFYIIPFWFERRCLWMIPISSMIEGHWLSGIWMKVRKPIKTETRNLKWDRWNSLSSPRSMFQRCDYWNSVWIWWNLATTEMTKTNYSQLSFLYLHTFGITHLRACSRLHVTDNFFGNFRMIIRADRHTSECIDCRDC